MGRKKLVFVLYVFLVLLFLLRAVQVKIKLNELKSDKTAHIILAVKSYFNDNLTYPKDSDCFNKYLLRNYEKEYALFLETSNFIFKIDSSKSTFKIILKQFPFERNISSNHFIHFEDYNFWKGIFCLKNILIYEDGLRSKLLLNLDDIVFVKKALLSKYSKTSSIYLPVVSRRNDFYEKKYNVDFSSLFFLEPYKFKVVMDMQKDALYYLVSDGQRELSIYKPVFQDIYISYCYYFDSMGVNRIFIPIILYDSIPPTAASL